MALFKIFKGYEHELNAVPLHEGYAYFCTDTGNMFIDISEEPGGRVPINAYAAEVLRDGEDVIEIDDILLKDAENGVPIELGGTGAISAEQARANLELYSKTEVENKVKDSTSVAYGVTLIASGWEEDLSYTVYINDLQCGAAGDVPPIVTCIENLDDYAKLIEIETIAEPAVKDAEGNIVTNGYIIFKAKKLPKADIRLIVVDMK